jgi:hypothetical protein
MKSAQSILIKKNDNCWISRSKKSMNCVWFHVYLSERKYIDLKWNNSSRSHKHVRKSKRLCRNNVSGKCVDALKCSAST